MSNVIRVPWKIEDGSDTAAGWSETEFPMDDLVDEYDQGGERQVRDRIRGDVKIDFEEAVTHSIPDDEIEAAVATVRALAEARRRGRQAKRNAARSD